MGNCNVCFKQNTSLVTASAQRAQQTQTTTVAKRARTMITMMSMMITVVRAKLYKTLNEVYFLREFGNAVLKMLHYRIAVVRVVFVIKVGMFQSVD